MKSIFTLIFVLLFSSPSFAYFIEGLSYDPDKKTIYVDIIFEGGKKEHIFTPLFDPCFYNENPNGLAVRLADSGWDDTGKELMGRRIPIDLNMQTHCLPANVTVYVGLEFDTIYIE